MRETMRVYSFNYLGIRLTGHLVQGRGNLPKIESAFNPRCSHVVPCTVVYRLHSCHHDCNYIQCGGFSTRLMMTQLHWLHNFSLIPFLDFYLIACLSKNWTKKVAPVWQSAFWSNMVYCTSFSSGTLCPASQGGTMRSLSSLWLYAALPALLLASHVSVIVEGDNDPSRICKPAPHWAIKGNAPMQELLGNVVVVALLKASWQFCLTQAAK